MNIRITIEGVGNFEINREKLQELLQWLNTNNIVQTKVQKENIQYPGSQLLNG